jgi:hypothetical protein
MANSILTSSIAVPFLAELEASLPIIQGGNVNFNREFVAGNGDSINILKPTFGNDVVDDGDLSGGSDLSDIQSGTVSVTLKQYSKGVYLTLVEQALKVSNMRDQIDVPMSSKMASDIQIKAWTDLWLSAGNVSVITTGSGAVTFANMGTGISMLHTSRSVGQKVAVLPPDLAGAVMASGENLFQNVTGKENWTNGTLGKYRGVDCYETQDAGTALVVGTLTLNTVAVNQPSAYVAGATALAIDATGLVGTLKAGMAFTVAGVYAVDVFGNATTKLYPFVLQADVTAAGNAASCTIQGVYATGPLKNVSALPVNDAVVTFLHASATTYQSILIWDKTTFAVASAKLAPMYDAKEQVSVNGKMMNLVMSKGGDFLTSKNYIRWDVLMGWKVIYQNLVARVDVKMT